VSGKEISNLLNQIIRNHIRQYQLHNHNILPASVRSNCVSRRCSLCTQRWRRTSDFNLSGNAATPVFKFSFGINQTGRNAQCTVRHRLISHSEHGLLLFARNILDVANSSSTNRIVADVRAKIDLQAVIFNLRKPICQCSPVEIKADLCGFVFSPSNTVAFSTRPSIFSADDKIENLHFKMKFHKVDRVCFFPRDQSHHSLYSHP
jgi:hypothetical protein